MAGKVKTVYICNQCGYESSKWNGKCPSCGQWNTLEEEQVTVSKSTSGKAVSSSKPADISDKIIELNKVDVNSDVRYFTGLKELDRVLGGGLVKGSLVLLGGEPGIGKSTLLLQICQAAVIAFLITRSFLVRCPECGKYQQSGKFCRNCGKELPFICKNCGGNIRKNDDFCNNCGKNVVK